jgi:Rrf2 family protein
MQITARAEYATRAMLTLAAAHPAPVTARRIAETQHIPTPYLYDILADLRRAELVLRRGGRTGGYTLARPAATITVAELLRRLGEQPQIRASGATRHPGDTELARRLHRLWSTAHTATVRVLDSVTLADIVSDAGHEPLAVDHGGREGPVSGSAPVGRATPTLTRRSGGD